MPDILAPVFGEKSQFDALTVVNKKSRPPTPKADGDVAKPKSSIPRPSKKDGAKKSGAKHTLEAVAPTVRFVPFFSIFKFSWAFVFEFKTVVDFL